VRTLDRRLLARARSIRVALGVDVALGLVATGLLITQAVIVATLVAAAFDGGRPGALAPLLVALAVVVAVRAALSGATETIGRHAAGRVMSELRLALVTSRLAGGATASSPDDEVGSGEIATAAVAGVDALEIYLARYLPQVVLSVTVPVAVLATALVADPTSAAIMLVTLPVIPVFLALVGSTAGARARERWAALAQLSDHVLDVLRGMPTLRAYNRADVQADLVAESGERYRRGTMQVLRLSFLSGAVLDLAATLGTALVAVTIGVRLIGGGLTLRAGLIVLLLTPELYAPLRALGTLFHASTDGLAAAGRILDVLDAGQAAPEGDGAPGTWQRVELAGATVEHPDRGGAVLRDVDLGLRRGEVVVLAGPSGAGKSTAAALLLGLRRPDAGAVLVDGRDLATLDLRAWRRQIGWLPQRPTMFRGTVRENIALADPAASPERVAAAAELAGVQDVVAELPRGYDTVIGPGGRGLSAGEQRRIALARALLPEPALLVLDEPFAHLDRASTAVVDAAIARVAPGRAVLVIEHDAHLLTVAHRTVTLTPHESDEADAADAADDGRPVLTRAVP
jgi:thiol reductant ABC exporter CydD subunit